MSLLPICYMEGSFYSKEKMSRTLHLNRSAVGDNVTLVLEMFSICESRSILSRQTLSSKAGFNQGGFCC